MRIKTVTPGLSLAASIVGLVVLALPSLALAGPALRVASGLGSVTIDATGVQTYTGLCSALTCPGTVTLGSGSISWTGVIGDFGVSTLTGRTKPSLGSPNIDLGVAAITSGILGGTITMSWTDTDFIVGSSPANLNIVAGNGSAVYSGYVDNGNAAFGTGTLVGTTTTGGILTGLGPTASPFSMTVVEVLTLPINLGIDIPPFNNDFSLQAAPNPPLTLGCGVASGQVNIPYQSGLVANGGVSPYNFSITAGSLPGGLTLNPITGAIAGSPTSAASFNFTAQAVDSSGLPGMNSATTSCGVVIAPPPPPPVVLSCGSSTGKMGSAYSSSLIAFGGTQPYTFSIVGGTLPANVFLNAMTGAIAGTPTAAGSSNFMAKVVDHSGNSATNSSTAACGLTITAPPVGSIGDRVWSDTNANGVQDSGEPGITGWTVTLKNATGGTVATTTTGANGAYTFGNLVAATYTVCVTPLANYSRTFDLDGVATPNCATGALTAGQNRTDFDFGYVPVAQSAPLTLSCATGTATVGVAYNSSVVVAGGTGPYSYSLSAGSLPAGLTLNASTGAITGTPTTSGTSGFSVKVVDSKGAVAFSTCTGTCSGGVTTTVSFNSHTGNLGTSETYVAGATSFNAYGFKNSGTATNLYGQNASGTASDGVGIDEVSNDQIDTAHFVQIDLTQAIAAGATNGQIMISGFNQCQYGESYDVYGSNTPGTLGTQLVSAGSKDRTFFAIPSFGTYKYISVRAHSGNVLINAISFTLPTTCSIKVAAALDVKCPASTATIGRSYTSSAGVTGGTAPYTFSVSWGKLPDGLSLNTSTGVISGTPTKNETAAFKIKVVDAAGAVDYSDCSGSCSSGTTVSYDLATSAGDIGVSHIYTSNALPLTAYGFTNAGAASSLYTTNYNSGDYSLGLKGGSNQIDSAHFVQFDISSLRALGATSAQIWVNSVDYGTSYDLYGSNTLGSVGTLLVNDTTKGATYLSIPNFGNYKYISVRGQAKDVLVGALKFSYPCTCAIDVNKTY